MCFYPDKILEEMPGLKEKVHELFDLYCVNNAKDPFEHIEKMSKELCICSPLSLFECVEILKHEIYQIRMPAN